MPHPNLYASERTPAIASRSASTDWAVSPLPVTAQTLPNGLRIVVHERPRVPVVASHLIYNIGSCDDPPHVRGLAHLLEHLLCQGSARYPKATRERMLQRHGGASNAHIDHDHTACTCEVPSAHWRDILGIEADRMRDCAFGDAEFARERDVVLAELRETMDDPWERIAAAADALYFGPGHPYAHPVLGDEAELLRLDPATAGRAYRRWFQPNNAVLALVGAVDAGDVLAHATELFADVPPGRTVTRRRGPDAEVPPRGAVPGSIVVEEDVHVERFWISYPAPARRHPHFAAALVLDYLLTSGETSLLWRHLVEQGRYASDILSSYNGRALAGNLVIFGEVDDSADGDEAIEAIDGVLGRLAEQGPDETALQKAKSQLYSTWVYGLDTAADIAEMLAEAEALLGGHGHGFHQMRAVRDVTSAQVRDVARQYLHPSARLTYRSRPRGPGRARRTSVNGHLTSITNRFGAAATNGAGNGCRPASAFDDGAAQAAPAHELPTLPIPSGGRPQLSDVWIEERFDFGGLAGCAARLANGLQVVCIHKPGRLAMAARLDLGNVSMRQPAEKAGLCALLSEMLIEGTERRDAAQIKETLDLHGMQLLPAPTGIGMRALARDADRALGLMAELVMRPTFPNAALRRRRHDRARALRAALESADALAKRALTSRLFPVEHPYGHLETPKSLATIVREDLIDFHAKWYRPNGARLVIAADVPLADQLGLIQRHFEAWEPTELPALALPTLRDRAPSRDRYIDLPGRTTCSMHLGHLGIRRDDPDYAALRVLDHVLGMSNGRLDRISRDLREERGIVYHASASITQSAGFDRGAFSASLSTSPSHVSLAVDRVREHMRALQRERIGDDELAAVKARLAGAHLFETEGLGNIVRVLATTFRHRLGIDYAARHRDELAAVTADDVWRSANRHLRPDGLHVVVVGPRPE